MKKNVTLTETLKVACGEGIVTILICVAFALMSKFTLSVLFGALYGSVLNILYFFLMCLGVNKTCGETDPKRQKATLSASYIARLILLGAGLVVGLKSTYFHKAALVIPVLMTRPILTVYELVRKEVK